MTDSAVDHPKHYNVGQIEVIDAIEALELGFHLGNAVKYLARAPHKGREKEDLEKACWYLQRARTYVSSQGGRLSTRTKPLSKIEIAGLVSDWKLPPNLGEALACIGNALQALSGTSNFLSSAEQYICDYLEVING